MRSTVDNLDGWSSVQCGLPSRREDRDRNRYSRRFTIEMKMPRLITHLLTCSHNGQRDTLSLATRQKRSGFSVQRLMLPAFLMPPLQIPHLLNSLSTFSSLLGFVDRLLDPIKRLWKMDCFLIDSPAFQNELLVRAIFRLHGHCMMAELKRTQPSCI